MVHTIAVLSDTHGVLPTLEAVLAEPDVQAADLVVVTGDLAAGPQPGEVLDRLVGLGERVQLVRGNADRDLVALARGETAPPGLPAIDRWAAQQLSAEQVELLASLPHPWTVDLTGVGEVLFCHGSPRDDNEVVLVDTRPSRWAEAFAGLPDSVRVVCCGHTHMPFARLVDRRWVVNSGSTGMPYGSTGVPWALLDSRGVHLRTTPIDPEAAGAAVIGGSSFPQVVEWVEEYVVHRASDLEALDAFGVRDGRGPGWNE
ncbi:metallophosphoesterase family protein [Calidifontibacter sp. DB0510]|uniref:Metallophosphoesterase family protein n=1 Tax=Metallococcus carri TaxID=1656884 RepID=A0A967EEI9_9MICO|nr:metallophosphoesterase family protein [Metallococcus carri]NHN55711.1 metallophosphoesterase family protein [Metallococcus carri]NOP38600.1 metallophosphoesterase family protein [Calidifontibacter sp. DB2511S]